MGIQMLTKTICVFAMAFLLSGCLATYSPSMSGPTAKLKVARDATSTICVNGTQNKLRADASGYAAIPAGEKITITAQYAEITNNIRFICIPAVSFTPAASETYLQTFEKHRLGCSTAIQVESSSATETIATSEPSSFGCNRP